VLPPAGAGEGSTPGLLVGVGSDNERKTGPRSEEGDGLAEASGEGSAFSAEPGALAGFSVPGVASEAGEAAGRITTRGVAEAPGEDAFSPGDDEGSVEGLVFSSSLDRLLR
jgi:hypothetical protein